MTTTLKQIRSTYLDFFAADGHTKVQSAPLVPQNDPTLMFVNAGMVPFKDYFTGAATPPYPRATSSQKCVRAGGKHNDLDNVGYTARHLTFFEMLGNFSFGDYFKEHAIDRAWNLVTKDFGLDPKRLLVTVYIDDDEAANDLEEGHRLLRRQDHPHRRLGQFLGHGRQRPLRPLHRDLLGPRRQDRRRPSRLARRGRRPLCGDLEQRLHAVREGERRDRSQTAQALGRHRHGSGADDDRAAGRAFGVRDRPVQDPDRRLGRGHLDEGHGEQAGSHRVIADHLRSSSFLIADGVTPSNEGRGYVLRRIMRRAMRHAHLLGATDPLMHRLVPTLVSEMGEAYPELGRAQAFIEDTLKQEEIRFRTTLGRGMALFDTAVQGFQPGDMLDGQTAFTLSDTYGFPLDLTQDEARRRGYSVNVDGFEEAMAEQRERGRANWKGSGQSANAGEWLALRDRLGPTVFTGYDASTARARSWPSCAQRRVGRRARGRRQGRGRCSTRPPSTARAAVRPAIGARSNGPTARVNRGPERCWMSRSTAATSTPTASRSRRARWRSAPASSCASRPKRLTTRANHSAATCCMRRSPMFWAPHVAQKGQMVDADRMRFDFSHNAPVTEAELAAMEDEVNAVIRQNIPAETKLMTPQDAIDAGADRPVRREIRR
jgi:alanyl-tRNA synthetase